MHIPLQCLKVSILLKVQDGAVIKMPIEFTERRGRVLYALRYFIWQQGYDTIEEPIMGSLRV